MFIREYFELAPLGRSDRAELLDSGSFRLADWAPDMLAGLRGTPGGSRLAVGIAKAQHLGYPDGGRWRDIVATAKSEGLGNIPTKLIPALRRAFTSQAAQSYIRIAHAPVILSNGRHYRFGFRSDGELLWLHGRESGEEDYWPANFSFLFKCLTS